jgi:hypothetical protein
MTIVEKLENVLKEVQKTIKDGRTHAHFDLVKWNEAEITLKESIRILKNGDKK